MSFSEGFSPHSESPVQFMIWAAIGVIGATLKNKVFFKHGTFTIYPNQYIILTADPGIGKGASIDLAYDRIAEKLGLFNTLSDFITVPKIMEKLSNGLGVGLPNATNNGHITFQKDSTAVIVSKELEVLLVSSSYMLPFLCQLWDQGKFNYETKNAGTSNVVSGLCISLIGACVPNYLRKINKDAIDTVNGGFTARALFVFADDVSKRIALPIDIESTKIGQKLIQELREDLQHIATLSGQMRFDAEAEHYYVSYYKSVQIKDDDSDIVRHFKRRMHVHLIKLSMIFSVSHRDDLIIGKIDLMNAIACIQDVMKNLDRAFRGVGESDIAEGTARVQDFIEKKGVCQYNEILANLHRHISPENLARVMSVMYQIGFCTETTVGNRKMIAFNKNFRKGVVSNFSPTSLVP